ncbi:MAG: sodium transport system ATP-binding protein [Planctomycetota bacterium]|jgi:sodium transport system ATP-binding protein
MSSSETPAILTLGLEKTYHDPQRGTVHAVRGVDLECKQGEIYGLLGPNGAGKTTTLRMLATILSPTGGSAQVAGISVGDDPLEVRRRIGFLSGTTGLYPRLTARETLEYFGKLHGIEAEELDKRIESLLDAFDMRGFQDGRCEGLSTGQRQRVSIARAVVHNPPVLILDEPTTGLDILAASDMIQFIESRKAEGTCVLFSTHILSEAERLCDRIGVIHAGRMLAVGSLDELRERTGKSWLEDVFRALVAESEDAQEEPSA